MSNLELREKFLNPSNVLPWDLLDLVQSVPQQSKVDFYDSLVRLPQSISRTRYRPKRKGIACQVIGCVEELNASDLKNSQSSNSISLKRKLAFKESSITGSTSNLPFKPGGISMKKSFSSSETSHLERDDQGLFCTAPGLQRGLNIGGDYSNKTIHDVEALDEKQDSSDEEDDNDVEKLADSIKLTDLNVPKSTPRDKFEKEIDDLLPVDINFGRSLKLNNDLTSLKKKDKQWARVIDLDHRIENFDELIPNMARTWPFELDTFQQEAVYHLEQGDSVFVAAHTSAGKTVIAEYAIAMANRNMTKAIYTSPIKALSNQKFRDFKQDFKDVDVGLITGDVQINPEASCLIMTTEILRSMLYKGADVIRDVEFVIFDEVHYVNDIDRGVVWEEVIIMLPDHVKFILLSATVPNTYEFANWVGRTKQKDIYVISTPKRPVPLEISIWAKKKLAKVIDADRKFLDKDYSDYLALYEEKKVVKPALNTNRGGRGGPGGARGNFGNNRGGSSRGGSMNVTSKRAFSQVNAPSRNTWNELVNYLSKNNLLPAVIFVFSKKRCEKYVDTLTTVDFCNAKEKSQIRMFIDRAVSRLKKEDRELPQILAIRGMLYRGIAVHHSGLLPLVKELVEILFSKTLIKILFATETFAMGLNLPTRTVVFSELRKHDGTKFRNLLPGEFTQMSGRAGRRGLDKIGTVIVMSYQEAFSKHTFKEVTLGTPTKLVSQFRLTYNMILNLLRIEALKVEEMIKHSFSENTSQTLLPEHERKIQELEEKLKTLPPLELNDAYTVSEVEKAFQDIIKYKDLNKKIMLEIPENPITARCLKLGRFLVFKDLKGISRIGVYIKMGRHFEQRKMEISISVLTFDIGDAENEEPTGLPYITRIKSFIHTHFKKMVNAGDWRVEEIPLTNVELICKNLAEADIYQVLQNNQQAIRNLKEQIDILLKFQHQLIEVHETGFATPALVELKDQKNTLMREMSSSNVLKDRKFKGYFKALNEEYLIKEEINMLKSLISDENLELLPDYEQRLEVLKELGFIDLNLNVQLKGRIACEIDGGWELVLTELILNNFLGDFEAEEIVALLSAFVYEGKSSQEEEVKITPRLEKGKQKILTIMQNTLDVYNKYQISLTSEEENFLERQRFLLVNVVYEWARGMSFKEIMELSTEAEGTIVRVITRLDEICRQVKAASLIIGDSSLHMKMNTAQELIKRDIVFCASLYL